MELKRAKEVLIESGLSDLVSGQTKTRYGIKAIHLITHIRWDAVEIHGLLDKTQMEAVLTWMRDPEGVVGA